MDFTARSAQGGLSASDVLDIRRLHDDEGMNDAQLARTFGVCRKAIYNIVEGRSWADVPRPTTVRGFKNYMVYPDGRVLSRATGTFLTPISRGTGPAVRVRTSGGTRQTIAVSTLLQRAKFS